MQDIFYIFNPEHDLCLANGDPHFVPPDSALEFGRDCAGITRWIDPGIVSLQDQVQNQDQLHNQPQNQCPIPTSSNSTYRRIVPWGWDAVLRKKLLKAEFPADLLPSDRELEDIRTLSNRKMAILAAEHIRRSLLECGTPLGCTPAIPTGDSEIECETPLHGIPAISTSDVEEVRSFALQYPDIVLKAPWSGSGKGLRWIHKELSASDKGWCKNTISKQGAVIVERRYKVVQDFAMLFSCNGLTSRNAASLDSPPSKCEQKHYMSRLLDSPPLDSSPVRFEGYSLFHTENGVWKGNLLASDQRILQELAQYIDPKLILSIKSALTDFLTQHFSGKYQGFIGVDMFIWQEAGNYYLNPTVEINVRMTMGLLARRIYDLHLERLLQDSGIGFQQAQTLNDLHTSSHLPNDNCGDAQQAQTDFDPPSASPIDGKYILTVEYSPKKGNLLKLTADSIPLSHITEDTRYAVVITLP